MGVALDPLNVLWFGRKERIHRDPRADGGAAGLIDMVSLRIIDV